MQLSVIHKQQVLTTPVSIYASQRDMQLALNALSKDFTVGYLLVFVCLYCFFSLKILESVQVYPYSPTISHFAYLLRLFLILLTISSPQVDVTRRGDYYNGYIYTVAFLTPVGYIEPVIVDVSQVEVSLTFYSYF